MLKYFTFNLFGLALMISSITYGHGLGVIGELPLNWHTDQITRVTSMTDVFGNYNVGRLDNINGKSCIEGSGFAFDVDERYAFDIDETVQLEVEFYLKETDSKAKVVGVEYERNGAATASKAVQIPKYQTGSHTYTRTFILDRARFANRGLFNTDFFIRLSPSDDQNSAFETITICNATLSRSYTTPTPEAYGRIALEVRNEDGRVVPARVGIYDATGRLPLPSNEAITVKRMNDLTRVVNLNPALIPWPASNPSGFYINGSYHDKLPVGRYELVISKGPEYRMVHQYFDVESDQTQTVKIKLQRWNDMPAKGWYSGDNHIHYIRSGKNDDPNLLLFTEAEDLHVANILQMGNIAGVHWPQYDWNPIINIDDPTYLFVPGQEDPRTKRVGHAISLHLKKPIRAPHSYLLYRPIFEGARAQGAVTGYAHVHKQPPRGGPVGIALDVPYNLVDFFEVMQLGALGAERWFNFLNLGYKLAPSAGTDYMWDFTLPGAERSYVRVEKDFTLQAWFDGLKRGETFVTNGPMLEFRINGKSMGSELQLKSGDKITIEASASINPDIDYLDSLELIEQGEVIKTVKAKSENETKLTLHYEATVQRGSWFVIIAKGKQPLEPRLVPLRAGVESAKKTALSGAIYVFVEIALCRDTKCVREMDYADP